MAATVSNGGALTSVTDMFDHIIFHGNKYMSGTKYARTWIFGHDALSQMWEKGALEYLKTVHGFGPERLVCRIGETLDCLTNVSRLHPHEYRGKKVMPPIGNRPEWMPLDSNLNADWERWTKHLCALTSDVPAKLPNGKSNPEKYGLGTPDEVAYTAKKAWESFPDSRIVQDMLRYPKALQAVVDCDGGLPVGYGKRAGRRSTLLLATPEGMEHIVKQREEKYEGWFLDDAETEDEDDLAEREDVSSDEEDIGELQLTEAELEEEWLEDELEGDQN